MATRRGVKGRWVFVPLPNWERLPPEFYCLRRSRVVLSLWFRGLPPELYDYCVTNAVLPPERLSFVRLVKFIEEHMTAAKAICGPAFVPLVGVEVCELTSKILPRRADRRERQARDGQCQEFSSVADGSNVREVFQSVPGKPSFDSSVKT